MAKVRGMGFVALLEYVRERKGEKGVEELLANFNADEKNILSNIKPKDWYPLDLNVRALTAADKMFGNGDLKLVKEMGRWGAEYNLKWFLKLFLSFATPQKIVKKWPTLWELNFDAGRLEVIKLEKNSATVRIRDFKSERPICLAVIGWGELSLEKTGAKNIRSKETKCTAWGDDCCEYQFEWE